MLKNKTQRILILLLTIAGLSFSVKAFLNPFSDDAPASGYIEQGVKITAQKFGFTPKDLNFKVNKTITVILTSVDGNHSFAIDKLNIKSREAKKGKSIVFEFAVNSPGRYEFYCAHGSHREKGMTGILEITPEKQQQ